MLTWTAVDRAEEAGPGLLSWKQHGSLGALLLPTAKSPACARARAVHHTPHHLQLTDDWSRVLVCWLVAN